MSTPAMKDGILVGFTDVPTDFRARDLLEEAGIAFNIAYCNQNGVHIYYNDGPETNVASYCPDTRTVLILRRPDPGRPFGRILIMDRRAVSQH